MTIWQVGQLLVSNRMRILLVLAHGSLSTIAVQMLGLVFKYSVAEIHFSTKFVLLGNCCWGHTLQKSEPGVWYLWFVPAGDLIWAWNHALLIILPASWGHSHTYKDAAGSPINSGRSSPLSYSGHQNSICCSNVSFPGDAEPREMLSTACVCIFYRWLWKARGKIFCPRHGVSFTGANHCKNKSLCTNSTVCVTFVLIFLFCW